MTVESTFGYAKAGEVNVAYRVTGSGPLDLLLVPDGAIPIEAMDEEPSFQRFLRRLESFARVIRYDRRGMGLSDPVTLSSPPTLEQWSSDAEAVLDAVGSTSTALLGMAEGGFVVCVLAATRPERISSLVLVNATPGIESEPFRAWGLAAAAHERLAELPDADFAQIDWGIPLFAPSAVDDSRYAEWLGRAMRHALSPTTSRAFFDVLYRSDIRGVLSAVRVPTLVIHRAGNRYLTTEHGRYLASRIPGAKLTEVEGEDHVPYLGDQTPILNAIAEFLTGERQPRSTDRVLLTLLFTDIVGSSERAAALGDERWAQLLDEHHACVRSELARYGGVEVDTAGDGFFATFDGPARAVLCAGGIIDAVRRLGLDVRAGVHTGECEVVGGKPAGLAVVVGARIAGLAGSGELLVSRTVKDLVAGSGLSFEDRGAHALKGVPDSWHVYSVNPGTAT